MLNKSILKKLKNIGFSIRKAQEAFLAVVKEAVEEIGGKQWKKRELPSLFRQLEKEIIVPLCHDEDGPQLSIDTFKKYMSAARKSLLFGVDFRMAWRISYDDLPRVKSLVDGDKSKRPAEDKLKDAMIVVKEEKQKVQKNNVSFARLPLPDLNDREAWVSELLGAISELLNTPEAKIIMRKNSVLKRLDKVCSPLTKAVA